MHYAKKSHIPRKPASLSSICGLFVLDPEAWKFYKVMSSEFLKLVLRFGVHVNATQMRSRIALVRGSVFPYICRDILFGSLWRSQLPCWTFQLKDIIYIGQRAGYLFIKLWTAHSRGIGLWQYFFVIGRNRRMTTPIMECLLLLITGCNKVWIPRAPSVLLQRFPVRILGR